MMENKDGNHLLVPKPWLNNQIEWNKKVVSSIEFVLPRSPGYDILHDDKDPRYVMWVEGKRLIDAADSFRVFAVANRKRPPRKRYIKRSPQLWLFPDMERRS
jgi:hypothetical protein